MEGKKEKNTTLVGNVKDRNGNNGKKEWKKPTLEDVSKRVMAQPYIRFT